MQLFFKIFLLSLLLPIASLWSQQDPVLTHFINDKMSLNPGKTGTVEGYCGTGIVRNQWSGVEGAPFTTALNLELNLKDYFLGGAGLSFKNDRIGFSYLNSLIFNYAHPIDVNYGQFRVGVGLGILNFGLNPDFLPPTQVFDPTLMGSFSSLKFDANLGLYFLGKNDYYVGLSRSHLTAPFFSVSDTLKAGEFGYRSKPHNFLMGGKKINGIFGGYIDGQALIRTDFIKLSLELNARYFKAFSGRLLYGGVALRSSDALSFLIGGMLNSELMVGFSYDVSVGKISPVSRGSQEIMVRYCKKLPPRKMQKYKHPRWL